MIQMWASSWEWVKARQKNRVQTMFRGVVVARQFESALALGPQQELFKLGYLVTG
jgi:hypothetical protein